MAAIIHRIVVRPYFWHCSIVSSKRWLRIVVVTDGIVRIAWLGGSDLLVLTRVGELASTNSEQ